VYDNFLLPGKASFLIGGQFGSEAKGAAAASLACQLALEHGQGFDICTTNASAQAGHTSIHNGVKRVAFHLPTVALIQAQDLNKKPIIYLNAGCAIDVEVLRNELFDYEVDLTRFFIHPNAAVITKECKEAEGRADSAQTKIASTRKGVGEAISRKVLRSGQIARDDPILRPHTRLINLNQEMRSGKSVCVEVPQGLSLSLNGHFYPYCTSRDCTLEQAMNDAGIHPHFYGKSMLVIRCYPIRVGAIVQDGKQLGQSGDCYPDQQETDWETLGQPAEITTVTKRVRRIFTFSFNQLADAMNRVRPDVVFISFCNYIREQSELVAIIGFIKVRADRLGIARPEIILESGPTTADVRSEDQLKSIIEQLEMDL
jgi:adenylosuccinate synthase